jgi:hypothetical protein
VSSEKDWLVIVTSDMLKMDEIFGRVCKTMEGSYIHRDLNIPYMIIKSSKKKIENIKQWLIILGMTDYDYIGKVNWIDRRDLET